jgi:hypothetical protein
MVQAIICDSILYKKIVFLDFYFLLLFLSIMTFNVKVQEGVIPTTETKIQLGGKVSVPPIGKINHPFC